MITLITNIIALVITICNLCKMIMEMVNDNPTHNPNVTVVINNINIIVIAPSVNNDKNNDIIEIE